MDIEMLVETEEVDELLTDLSCTQRGIHSGSAGPKKKKEKKMMQLWSVSLKAAILNQFRLWVYVSGSHSHDTSAAQYHMIRIQQPLYEQLGKV